MGSQVIHRDTLWEPSSTVVGRQFRGCLLAVALSVCPCFNTQTKQRHARAHASKTHTQAQHPHTPQSTEHRQHAHSTHTHSAHTTRLHERRLVSASSRGFRASALSSTHKRAIQATHKLYSLCPSTGRRVSQPGGVAVWGMRARTRRIRQRRPRPGSWLRCEGALFRASVF
jgi:hypothetical protein